MGRTIAGSSRTFSRQRVAPLTGIDQRFVFVTGKGGVGKTTVSAGLAVAASRSGQTVLLASTDPVRYRDLLPGARWKTAPTQFADGLSVVHVTPEAALEEYGRLLIKPRLARLALFNNRAVQGFLRAIPGLEQWAVLGKVWYHTTEEEGGGPRFDRVVFDAPATGHGLEMLRVPRVITEIAPRGLLRRDADRAWHMLCDPRTSCIALVTLPEELPANEALELSERITSELQLPLGVVIANRVCPPLFSPSERLALIGVGEPGAALAVGVERAHREQLQLESLSRLAQLPAPLIQLPDVDASANGDELVQRLATEFLSPSLLPPRPLDP